MKLFQFACLPKIEVLSSELLLTRILEAGCEADEEALVVETNEIARPVGLRAKIVRLCIFRIKEHFKVQCLFLFMLSLKFNLRELVPSNEHTS